jgi:hypothetical protein
MDENKVKVQWKNGYVSEISAPLAKIYESRGQLRVLPSDTVVVTDGKPTEPTKPNRKK